MIMSILVAVIIGILLPIQTSVNSRLGRIVTSPFVSSMISFTVATIFLIVVSLIDRSAILVPLSYFQTAPWWVWLGGLVGVIGLTANILLFQVLGSVQTVIMPILGQILMSLLIDNFGWFDVSVKHLTLVRGLGAVLLIIGVVLMIVVPNLRAKQDTKTEHGHNQWIWQIAGVIAGMFMASQSAINGKLGTVLGSPFHAALVSFFMGMVILIVLVGVKEHGYSKVKLAVSSSNPWWIWMGGILGSLFVFGNAYLVPLIGTGALVVLALVGQMVTSLVVDQFGLLGAQVKKVIPAQFIGLAIMIAGVVLIELI